MLALSRIIELQNVLDHEHAVLEVLRVNLRRYLKFMDDPIKEISFLDEEGNVCFHKTKKVYHVYVGINWEPKCGHPIFQNYKIVLNKKGIQRVELLAS